MALDKRLLHDCAMLAEGSMTMNHQPLETPAMPITESRRTTINPPSDILVESELDSPEFENYDPSTRVYTVEQLEILNLVVHPIWIFDYIERRMRWANLAGVELWDADSLDELQHRDFREISAASAKRMEAYLIKFERGMNISDQWTMYPKGKARTVHMNVSGVRFPDDDHFSLLCEGIPVLEEKLLHENLRGVEMLRNLPMGVCQFDIEGKLLFQNPEASMMQMVTNNQIDDEESLIECGHSSSGSLALFDDVEAAAGSSSSSQQVETDEARSMSSTDGHSIAIASLSSHKLRKRCGNLEHRFVDRELGKSILREISLPSSSKMEVEAMLHTQHGPRWCAIQVSKAQDPVTGEPVLLYSAQDKSDAVAAKKEREARERKSEFLAIMAHEIRTPLHQVTGFIDLLDETSLDAEQRSYIKLLKSSAQGLMTVISDVLDYSKLEAGKMKLENIPYEPLSVVEGSIEAVRTSCEEKKLYLKLDWNKEIPFKLQGDPNRLRQILLNLLSNAVKFTKHGGIVVQAFPTTELIHGYSNAQTKGKVETKDHNGDKGRNIRTSAKRLQHKKTSALRGITSMIKFVVSDTGVGIRPEHRDLIFRKYQQGNASVARNFGGTGLGLSICQSLVTNMGGLIGFDSEVGQGTSFWFQLPADVPMEQVEEEVLGRKPVEKSEEEDTGLNILIAEDNKVNQKLLGNMLKRMGHSFTFAVNGKIAIELLEKYQPQKVPTSDPSEGKKKNFFDVVLMDIQMPVMDGLEATRRLRTMGYHDLPIYGLTASVIRSDFVELGFNDWIAKPIPMKELKIKLHRLQQNMLEASSSEVSLN